MRESTLAEQLVIQRDVRGTTGNLYPCGKQGKVEMHLTLPRLRIAGDTLGWADRAEESRKRAVPRAGSPRRYCSWPLFPGRLPRHSCSLTDLPVAGAARTSAIDPLGPDRTENLHRDRGSLHHGQSDTAATLVIVTHEARADRVDTHGLQRLLQLAAQLSQTAAEGCLLMLCQRTIAGLGEGSSHGCTVTQTPDFDNYGCRAELLGQPRIIALTSPNVNSLYTSWRKMC